MPQRQPMSSVDRSWLLMDGPTNRTVINGFWVFDQPVEYERVLAILQERLLVYNRFRQRIVETSGPLGRAWWENDPHFDVRSHLHRIGLPNTGDKASLQALMAELIVQPLDRSRPLWDFYLIDNYRGGNVLFGRIHHCVGDGVALVQVLLSLTDTKADGTFDGGPKRRSQRSWNPLRPLFKGASQAMNAAVQLGGGLVSGGLELLGKPEQLLELVGEGGRAAGQVAGVLAKLALMTTDTKTVFQGELGIAKRVAWSEPIDLEDVKLVKNVMGATVNDVLMAALTGALRNYLLERGERVDGKEIRAMVPVNIRGIDATPPELGNKFALVYLALPVGVADPLDRLFAVKRRMDEIKASPEALITYQILSGVGRTPGELATLIARYFASKASAVLTNVPGPQQKLYFAGKRFETMVFWVPQSGSIGMGLSIYSYVGEVTIGVITDEKRVPDPETIVQGFVDEFNWLLALARLPAAEEAARRSRVSTGLVSTSSTGAGPTGVQEIPIQAEQSPKEAIAELLGQLAAAQAEPEPHRCTATTKSGARCRNRRGEGSEYCHLHQTAERREEGKKGCGAATSLLPFLPSEFVTNNPIHPKHSHGVSPLWQKSFFWARAAQSSPKI